MNIISNLFIPIIVLTVVIHGAIKKINVYDTFIEGAKESFEMILNMFPAVLAMVFGVNIFVNSGLIDSIFAFFKPILVMMNIPMQILPIAVMRPLSGSFGLALLNDMYSQYGPDNIISIMASVIQGSSDTTLYILTLYFGTIGIKKIKYALWVGLLSDFAAVFVSIIIVVEFR
jgi:spore maturation protein B